VPPLGHSESAAQAFAAGATFGPRAQDGGIAKPSAQAGGTILGAPCRIRSRKLYALDQGGDHNAPHPVMDLFLAEISCAPFPVTSRPDLMVIAIVAPKSGEGIGGTQLGGTHAGGRDAWFILSPGSGQQKDVLDALSAVGCIRTDLLEAFKLSGEGDGVIGEGAYATVRCMRARDGTAVAVKQMNATVELPAIERELATLIEMQPHENIVGFRGMFWQTEVDGSPRVAVAFDLAPCGDLLYKVLKFGAMVEADARTPFVGLMRALAHIHARNIVHRDIKAENILLKANDVVVVADFGLATWVTDAVQMARRCGSPGYVAPEVCLGTPYSFKVDVFGAGVVLYFLLSMEMPSSSPDRDTAATMRRTVRCSLHLHRPPWDKMTSRLRNMLRQTICKSQEERLTSEGVLEHPWLTGPVPRPPLTPEQLAHLQEQQNLHRKREEAKASGMVPPEVGASGGGGPPRAPMAQGPGADAAGGGAPVADGVAGAQSGSPSAPPGRPQAPAFRRGPRSGAYPGGGHSDRPPEAPNSMLPGLPSVSPGATAAPTTASCATPMSQAGSTTPHPREAGYPAGGYPNPAGGAAGGGNCASPTNLAAGRGPQQPGPHLPQHQQTPVFPPGDDDDPPLFPVGAGAIVAEARAAAAAAAPDVDAPSLSTRNVRRLGGLPPPSARD